MAVSHVAHVWSRLEWPFWRRRGAETQALSQAAGAFQSRVTQHYRTRGSSGWESIAINAAAHRVLQTSEPMLIHMDQTGLDGGSGLERTVVPPIHPALSLPPCLFSASTRHALSSAKHSRSLLRYDLPAEQ
jgi:hypothetical protein